MRFLRIRCESDEMQFKEHESIGDTLIWIAVYYSSQVTSEHIKNNTFDVSITSS